MSGNRWIDGVVRFGRSRARRFFPEPRTRHAALPDYDIPTYIRRGIRIAGLEAFHAASPADQRERACRDSRLDERDGARMRSAMRMQPAASASQITPETYGPKARNQCSRSEEPSHCTSSR